VKACRPTKGPTANKKFVPVSISRLDDFSLNHAPQVLIADEKVVLRMIARRLELDGVPALSEQRSVLLAEILGTVRLCAGQISGRLWTAVTTSADDENGSD
jgi:hypothetical protein